MTILYDEAPKLPKILEISQDPGDARPGGAQQQEQELERTIWIGY
jgi:hypothetical protein